MRDVGHDVLVVAPADDRSGSSAAVGPVHMDDGIPVQRVELGGLEGTPVYAIDAPPALCVLGAVLGAYGAPPELVVSGINRGPNTGASVLHSGTVGAALAGANFGVSGVAVSIMWGEPSFLHTASSVAVATLDWLAAEPAGSVLNVNVPNRALSDISGVSQAALARFGTVRAALREGESEAPVLEIRADGEESAGDGTDTALLAAGYVTVTSLAGVQSLPHGDAALALTKALPGLGGSPK
ncbi:MAG: 5'/3'-nucleotidase SurE [Actinomycetota bacterium]|nr:5'/3'-nucleotidase SurE [Actinomycetota bacterium]